MDKDISLSPMAKAGEQIFRVAGASHPDLVANTQNLDSRVLGNILNARNQQWLQPPSPISVDETVLRNLTTDLCLEIEELFGANFAEEPSIKVVEPDEFLPTLNASELKTSHEVGDQPFQLTAPPSMFTDQVGNQVIMPRKYLLRVRSDFAAPEEIRELEWDQPFLEEILCEELTHILFRQLRGEFREGYVHCMRAIGTTSRSRISVVNEAVAQHIKELNVFAHRPQWGIYVASDLLAKMQRREDQIAYRAVAALSKNFTIAQISMADEIDSRGGNVHIAFDEHHPNHAAKKQRFGSQTAP